MNPRQSQIIDGQASPSSFLGHDQNSQISLNPSFIEKRQLNNSSTIQINNNQTKKRLKFDKFFQDQIGNESNNFPQAQSQQQFEIEFHLSNCLKRFSDFFKSQKFRYLYVTILVLFLINCTLEAAQISHIVLTITQKIDLGFQVFFTLGLLVKFTQYQNQHTFWIGLDLITNICGYLSYGLNDFPEPVRYFKAIKIIRLLMIVKDSTYLQVPAAKLIYSLSSVGKILFPAVLFIYFYAVIGLYSFRDYEYSKCRDPSNKLLSSNWTVYTQQVFLCGQKQCPIVDGVQYQCLNPIDFGIDPNPYQVKNLIQGQGLMRYNNIFYSLFSTFKQTFITGSSRLMISGKQVTNYFYVLIYYLSFIYLLAYIYLNIFYGLMITNEQQAQPSKRQSSFELKLNRKSSKRRQNIDQQNEQKNQTTQKPLLITGKTSSQMSPSFTTQINQIGLKKTISSNLPNINQIQEQQKSQFQQIINLETNQLQQNINTNKLKVQPKHSLFAQQFQSSKINNSQSQNQNNYIRSNTQQQETYLKYGQIMKKYFLVNHMIIILCSINILIDFQGQTYSVKLIVDVIDFVFFWIYMVQMIFRIAIHFKFVSNQPFDKAFKLDLILFAFCTGGLIYEVATARHFQHFVMASDDISRLLRTLKYLRIFILISSTPFFNEARIIFNSTLEAVYSVRSFSSLWLLMLVTFSIMGYHMFQGKTKVDHQEHLDLVNGHAQHIAFQGIEDSFIYTAFIFFNEQWDLFLFQQYVSQQTLIVIWQLLVLLVGLQVLSKYFMALLMKQLGDKLNQQQQLAQKQDQEGIQDEEQVSKILSNDKNINKISPEKTNKKSSLTFKLKQKQSINYPQIQIVKKPQLRDKRISINAANGLVQVRNQHLQVLDMKKQKQKRQSMMRDLILRQNQSQKQENTSKKNSAQIINKKNNIHNQSDQINQVAVQSISCLQKPKMRIFFLLKSKFFTFLKICVILISIVCTLAMNPQEDPNSQTIQNYKKVWYSTVMFFGIQMVLSIFAFGLFNQKTGYFRNIMNWIYMIVFAIEIISIIPGITESGHLQSLLSFRILRIFVFVELKYQADSDMRLTMVGFWKLLPKVINLLAITIIMYGFFAIILVKLYKDDFYYCDQYPQEASIVTQTDCMNWGGSWLQRKMNVSNIFKSLQYLFLLATTQGWSIQVIEAASLSGKGNQPEYGHNIWMEYFFSIFFFFGNMIMLNVFIGLSVYNFQKIKSQVTGLTRLSKDNKMWFSIKNTIHRLSPKMKDTPPQNCISNAVHTFRNSKGFQIMNVFFFIIFMINMSLYETNMSEMKQKILDSILYLFIGLFIVEYATLWIAYGLRAVKQRTFIFETIGTTYLIILLCVTNTIDVEPKVHRILYGIAVCGLAIRCFALLNDIEFVRKMINSLVSIFPQTSNIWLLMFVVLFSYAVIGIYFFGYLKIGVELNQYDQNYVDLKNAVYALIKFSTLQSPILQIIDATTKMEPNSVCYDMYSYQEYMQHGRMGCGNPTAGYIFFFSFHIIYSLILLSTLLAVIVDAYSQVRRQQQSMVNKFQLQQVQKQWEQYDPEATGYISYRDFWMFTAKLVKIYKVNKQQLLSHQTKQSFLKSLQIPIYENQNGVLSFQFHEVVQALTRIVVKQKMGSDWDTRQADKVFKNHHHQQSQMKMFKKSMYDSSHVLTLIIVKSGLKVWKRKAVNVENQQHLQNLFSFAKSQKQKADNNTEIMNQTLNLAQTGKKIETKINLAQPKQKQQQNMPMNIQKTALQLSRRANDVTQSSIQQVSITKNLQQSKKDQSAVPLQTIKFATKISTSNETVSKVKSPRDNTGDKNTVNFVVNKIGEDKAENEISVEQFQ